MTQNKLKELSEAFKNKWGNAYDISLDNACRKSYQDRLNSNKSCNVCDNKLNNSHPILDLDKHNSNNLNSFCHSGLRISGQKCSLNRHASNTVCNPCQNGAGERCDNVKSVDIKPGDILDVLHGGFTDFNLDLLKDMSQFKNYSTVGGQNSHSAAQTLTSCQTSVNIAAAIESEDTQTGAVFPFREYYSSSENYQTQPVFPGDASIKDDVESTCHGETALGAKF